MNKGRFEAFSDGVYAFAITLLILGIALPEFAHPPADAQFWRVLVGLWPKILAYALSFAVIGIMWQNHHAIFRLVPVVDRTTVLLNLLLLAVTVFVPFATSTLGSFPRLRGAAFLYGLTLSASGAVYNLLVWHLVRQKRFARDVSEDTIRQTVHAYRVGFGTYAAATLTALVAPTVSVALYALVAVYFLIPRGADADLTEGSKERRQ
jgi:uncharacterized membrane protein